MLVDMVCGEFRSQQKRWRELVHAVASTQYWKEQQPDTLFIIAATASLQLHTSLNWNESFILEWNITNTITK
jgi:hypothetical protein